MAVIAPSVITAYTFELRGSLIAGSAGIVVNVLVVLLLRENPVIAENWVPTMIGSGTNVLLAVMIGSNRSLVSRLRHANSRIEELATIDELTGLSNRRHALQMLEERISEARRQGYALTAATVDLDNLKLVNDTGGHARGDALLRAFSEAALHAVRSSDTVCRLGGDEFFLILPYCGDACAHRVLTRVEAYFADRWGDPEQAAFSFGLAMASTDDTVDSLLDRSDRLMFENKRRRKAGQPVPKPADDECLPGGAPGAAE